MFLVCPGVDEWYEMELDPDNTKFIIIGDKLLDILLYQNFLCVIPSKLFMLLAVEVKHLGVTFVSENTLDNHMEKVCCASYYHLKYLLCIS